VNALTGKYGETSAREKENLEALSKMLFDSHGIKFEFNYAIKEDTEEVKKMYNIVKSMREPLMPRDIVKMKNMADAIKTVRELKSAFASDDPFKEYMGLMSDDEKAAITIADVAYSASMLALSKQKREEGIQYPDPTTLINAAMKEYISIENDYRSSFKDKANNTIVPPVFDYNDATRGVKNFAVTQALHAAMKWGVTGHKNEKGQELVKKGDYVGALVQSLKDQTNRLSKLKDDNKPLRNIMLAHLIGDITTLAAFAGVYYKDDVQEGLKNKKDGYFDEKNEDTHSNAMLLEDVIMEVYNTKQKVQAVSFPSYFEHRIPRIIRSG
jgi:hypothetical protein